MTLNTACSVKELSRGAAGDRNRKAIMHSLAHCLIVSNRNVRKCTIFLIKFPRTDASLASIQHGDYNSKF